MDKGHAEAAIRVSRVNVMQDTRVLNVNQVCRAGTCMQIRTRDMIVT